MRILLRLAVLSLCLLAPGMARADKTLALVIGVNNYQHVPTLDGARSDAIDLASSLQRMGAATVITLIDQEASKDNVTSSWQALLAQAQSGDVIVLSYAGHGAQAPERTKGEEKDGLDEFWVLPGFDPGNIRATWQETVFDNELFGWFRQAADRGVRVVFISDSCHAGGMNRAATGRLRYVDFGKSRILGELLSLMLSRKANGTPDEADQSLPDNVTMLAATGEAFPVPEVVIDGQPRGALSWSVARAFDGMADANGDGMLDRPELEDYVLSNVRARSESLQTPVFAPVVARLGQQALFSLRPGASMQVASHVAGQGAQRPLPMAREMGYKPVLTLSVIGTDLRPADTVAGGHGYEWNAARGIFKTPNGEVAAVNVSARTIDNVVAKYIALDFLQAIATRRPGSARITPEKDLYYQGERLHYGAARDASENTLVFNLANTGEVQFLDMISNESPSRTTFLKEMQVVAPFGADHLITISTKESLNYIGSAVERGVSAKELKDLLASRLDGIDAAVSIVPLYTRQK